MTIFRATTERDGCFVNLAEGRKLTSTTHVYNVVHALELALRHRHDVVHAITVEEGMAELRAVRGETI